MALCLVDTALHPGLGINVAYLIWRWALAGIDSRSVGVDLTFDRRTAANVSAIRPTANETQEAGSDTAATVDDAEPGSSSSIVFAVAAFWRNRSEKY